MQPKYVNISKVSNISLLMRSEVEWSLWKVNTRTEYRLFTLIIWWSFLLPVIFQKLVDEKIHIMSSIIWGKSRYWCIFSIFFFTRFRLGRYTQMNIQFLALCFYWQFFFLYGCYLINVTIWNWWWEIRYIIIKVLHL